MALFKRKERSTMGVIKKKAGDGDEKEAKVK
jgi:hypothetical protein